jgi:hypothetical protein
MRGAERPSRVAWTHPFLPPLQPLSDDAALKTFIDITDGSLDNEDMKRLLLFTDNMPLAVELIAHLVDYEGNENVLTRWGIEKTSLLSAGHDRRSNLDASISLSLSSPQITAGANTGGIRHRLWIHKRQALMYRLCAAYVPLMTLICFVIPIDLACVRIWVGAFFSNSEIFPGPV